MSHLGPAAHRGVACRRENLPPSADRLLTPVSCARTCDDPRGAPLGQWAGDSDGCLELPAGFAGDVVHDPERHGLVRSEVLVDVLKCLLLCCGDVGAGGRDEPELEATGRQLGDLHLPQPDKIVDHGQEAATAVRLRR